MPTRLCPGQLYSHCHPCIGLGRLYFKRFNLPNPHSPSPDMLGSPVWEVTSGIKVPQNHGSRNSPEVKMGSWGPQNEFPGIPRRRHLGIGGPQMNSPEFPGGGNSEMSGCWETQNASNQRKCNVPGSLNLIPGNSPEAGLGGLGSPN